MRAENREWFRIPQIMRIPTLVKYAMLLWTGCVKGQPRIIAASANRSQGQARSTIWQPAGLAGLAKPTASLALL